MPAYHSSFNKDECRLLCGMALLPIKSQYKGPAPKATDPSQPDIIDEALDFFKANVLFRNYEVKGPADRVLVYLTLYISECLVKIGVTSKGEAEKLLFQNAISNFAVPGDRNFTLAGFVQNPKARQEAGMSFFSPLFFSLTILSLSSLSSSPLTLSRLPLPLLHNIHSVFSLIVFFFCSFKTKINFLSQQPDTIRQYLTQLRQETGLRLVQRVYGTDDTTPSKWWTCFSKRKFLNKTL
ncbi:subunit of the Arp2/3 complex, variant 3 [Balamuthia mandrillaris]